VIKSIKKYFIMKNNELVIVTWSYWICYSKHITGYSSWNCYAAGYYNTKNLNLTWHCSNLICSLVPRSKN